MSPANPQPPRNLGSLEEALRTIQERSDDIEWAEIFLSERVLTFCGYPAAPLPSGTMVLHLLNERFLLRPTTTEAVLNDGILNRIGIRINLTA